MRDDTSLTVKDVMLTSPVNVDPETDVMDAMHQFITLGISGALVVDAAGHLVGVLSERDCLHSVVMSCYFGEFKCGPVEHHMSTDIKSVNIDISLLEVAELFDTTKYRRFPVIDEGQVVGLITRRDVIEALLSMA